MAAQPLASAIASAGAETSGGGGRRVAGELGASDQRLTTLWAPARGARERRRRARDAAEAVET